MTESDAPNLDALYERGRDYIRLAEGHDPQPGAAQATFSGFPAGYSKNDVRVFGLIAATGELIGALQLLVGYPDSETLWIGLLLVDPSWRSAGIGHQVISWLAAETRRQGFVYLSLAVIDENQEGLRFWLREGFVETSVTESLPFGMKVHEVHFLTKHL